SNHCGGTSRGLPPVCDRFLSAACCVYHKIAASLRPVPAAAVQCPLSGYTIHSTAISVHPNVCSAGTGNACPLLSCCGRGHALSCLFPLCLHKMDLHSRIVPEQMRQRNAGMHQETAAEIPPCQYSRAALEIGRAHV